MRSWKLINILMLQSKARASFFLFLFFLFSFLFSFLITYNVITYERAPKCKWRGLGVGVGGGGVVRKTIAKQREPSVACGRKRRGGGCRLLFDDAHPASSISFTITCQKGDQICQLMVDFFALECIAFNRHV